LAPWPDPVKEVFQPGAWIVPDERPLSREVEAFLDTGDPPVYFGFGSMRAPRSHSDVIIETAHVLGRRAIVSRRWADLSVVAGDPDCLAVDEVNQQALFKRVAAVVHHGGAGTTTTASVSRLTPKSSFRIPTTKTTGQDESAISASEGRTDRAP